MATRIYINEVARVCRALSKPSRVAVLLAMEEGSKHSITSLQEEIGLTRKDIGASLSVLERTGFVKRVLDPGRIRWYEPTDPGLPKIIRGLVMRN